MTERSESEEAADALLFTGMAKTDSGGFEEGARTHRPLEIASRTAQLLFLGSIIAIMGLFFSLSLVIFRATCDSHFKLATRFSKEGRFSDHTPDQRLCKTGPIDGKPIPVERLGHKHVEGLVSKVTWKPCTKKDDCKQFSGGFCAGGLPGNNSDEEFCKGIEGTWNECTCRVVIWDCGLNQEFLMKVRLGDYVLDCQSEFCDSKVNISIPKWTLYRSDIIGCESKHSTSLKEAMAHVQDAIEMHGIRQPLMGSTHKIWSNLSSHLDETFNLEFDFFWPSTISESVADPWSPEQAIFVGFMICASFCLFRSDYTSECKRVSLPHKKVPFLGFEWNTVRAWLPPLGLILLSMVEMVPFSEIYNFPDGLMTAVHLVGAQFCFVVYLQAEFASLWDEENAKTLAGSNERVLRWALNILGFVSMGTFGLSYGFVALVSGKGQNPYVRPSFMGGTCDLYIRDSLTEQSTMVRPAGELMKYLKLVSYFAEFMVAFSILVSHLVIWYFFSTRVHQRWQAQLDRKK